MLQTQVNYWDLVEKARHNRVTETQGFESIDVSRQDLAERHRHNVMSEGQLNVQLNEQARHNVATENLTGQQIDIQRQTLANQMRQIELGFANLALDQSRLRETQRSNRANESIRSAQVDVSRMQASASQAQAAAAQANANTSRIQALNAVSQTAINDRNTRYANKTARLNAITNEKNATLREMELVNAQRETNIHETNAITNMFSNLSNFIRR